MKSILFSLLLLAAGVSAQTSTTLAVAPPPSLLGTQLDIVSDDDAVTIAAVHAALLGDGARLEALSRERKSFEEYRRKKGSARPLLAENLALLSGASRKPLASSGEVKRLLSGLPADQTTRHVRRLVEDVEPRSRYQEAAADAAYQSRRSVFNSLSGGAASLMSLQLFGLVQPPIDLIQYLAVGHQYLNPEERKELRAARDLKSSPAAGLAPRAVDGLLESWNLKRRNLAVLQARRNGDLFRERGEMEAAEWWYRREMGLKSVKEPSNPAHLAVLRELNVLARRRQSAGMVTGDEAALAEPSLFVDYSSLLNDFVLRPRDPQLLTRIEGFLADHPLSGIRNSARAAAAASCISSGQTEMGRLYLRQLGSSKSSVWKERASDYLEHSQLNPAAAFDEAESRISGRTWRYVLTGKDPRVAARGSMDAETARVYETAGIRMVRTLFITDSLPRLLFLPFLSAFPKDELFDAMHTADPNFFGTNRGKELLRHCAEAYESLGRHTEAAAAYDRLGDIDAALKARQHAAREMERQADKEESPEVRIAILQRLANAYPNYQKIERVREKTAKAELESSLVGTIRKDDLRKYPEISTEAALALPAALLDGLSANGEISSEGVTLYRPGLVRFIDSANGFPRDRRISAEQTERAAQLLYPLRRMGAVQDELDKPLRRKRIPIAIEGGAVPGFEAAPGLVPLEPDPRERSLYE